MLKVTYLILAIHIQDMKAFVALTRKVLPQTKLYGKKKQTTLSI